MPKNDFQLTRKNSLHRTSTHRSRCDVTPSQRISETLMIPKGYSFDCFLFTVYSFPSSYLAKLVFFLLFYFLHDTFHTVFWFAISNVRSSTKLGSQSTSVSHVPLPKKTKRSVLTEIVSRTTRNSAEEKNPDEFFLFFASTMKKFLY